MSCPFCGLSPEPDMDYPNIYGTYCKKCGHHIPPPKDIDAVVENKNKLKLMQATVRQLLREKLFGKQK